jgi:hypothetical protein
MPPRPAQRNYTPAKHPQRHPESARFRGRTVRSCGFHSLGRGARACPPDVRVATDQPAAAVRRRREPGASESRPPQGGAWRFGEPPPVGQSPRSRRSRVARQMEDRCRSAIGRAVLASVSPTQSATCRASGAFAPDVSCQVAARSATCRGSARAAGRGRTLPKSCSIAKRAILMSRGTSSSGQGRWAMNAAVLVRSKSGSFRR